MIQDTILIVHEDFLKNTTSFYLRRYEGSTRVIIGQKDNQLLEQRNDSVCSIEPIYPLLEMPSELANIFLKAVGDYNSGKGNVTENENKLKGKLEATEKHLEDLRTYFGKSLDKLIKLK